MSQANFLFRIFMFFSMTSTVFANETEIPKNIASTKPLAKTVAQGCPSIPNSLCLNPIDQLVLVLHGCATGSSGGFPPFHINVPPGNDLRFSVLIASDSPFGTFSIVSEEVSNGNGVDPCLGGPGVFVGPVPISDINNPFPVVHTVPSAVVDQMIAAVAQDGFVVNVALQCPGAILFSGLDFTRNVPASSTDLSLSLTNGPGQVFTGDSFDVEFQIANNGDEEAVNPEVRVPIPFGAQFISGDISGIGCFESDGQVVCPSFNLAPLATANGIITFAANLGGKLPLELNLSSEICDGQTLDNQVFLSPLAVCPPDMSCFFGLGFDGGGMKTSIWVDNPVVDSPANIHIFATDPNCRPTEAPFGGPGTVSETLPGGTAMSFESQGTQPQTQPVLFWVETDNAEVVAEVRPSRHIGGADPRFFASTLPMIRDIFIGDYDGDYPIPFADIVTGQNQAVHFINLNNTAQSVTGNLRNTDTGNLTTQFNTTVEPFEIQTFPLNQLGLPGADPQMFWKSGGQGVLTLLSDNSDDGLNIIPPGLLPPQGSGALGVGLFLPHPDNMEYDPSDLELMIVKPDGSGVPGGLAESSFDNDCGPQTPMTRFDFFTNGDPFVPIFLPIEIDDRAGGILHQSPPQTVPTVRWREGNSQLFVRAQTPVQEWKIHVPDVTLEGEPPQIPQIRVLIQSDMDITIPVAVFDESGEFLNFKFIDVPQGGHLFCLEDITETSDASFFEFSVPQGHQGEVRFDAISDIPGLEYKDQIPTHGVQNTRVSEFTKVLEAWNGSAGTSCLGEAPDILDIVNFMNNGLKCP